MKSKKLEPGQGWEKRNASLNLWPFAPRTWKEAGYHYWSGCKPKWVDHFLGGSCQWNAHTLLQEVLIPNSFHNLAGLDQSTHHDFVLNYGWSFSVSFVLSLLPQWFDGNWQLSSRDLILILGNDMPHAHVYSCQQSQNVGFTRCDISVLVQLTVYIRPRGPKNQGLQWEV